MGGRQIWGVGLAAALLALTASAATLAQAPGTAPRPGTVETAPLAPPGGAPAPTSPPSGATAPSAPAPSAAQPATPPPPSRPTLVEKPGDPNDVDEVTLPAKPAAILSGKSTWDDGLASVRNAFRRIEEELTRAGIRPAGRPLAVFVETDDTNFTYDALVPIEWTPDSPPPTLPQDIRFGTTPEGRALRFVHQGPYDDIDSTYETITAYLDAKGVVVKDAFIEEYVNDVSDPQDDSLEINIFVQPR